MFFLRTLLLFLFGTLCCHSQCEAQHVEQGLSFADALFAEGDYYRAVTEYKRFLHFFPNDSKAPQAALQIARSFASAQRWEQAESASTRVFNDFPETAEAGEAALLYAEIPYQRKDFATARKRYQKILGHATGEEARSESRYRIAWTFIEEKNYPGAKEALLTITEKKAEALTEEMKNLDRLPEKSPRLAGVMSAVLPGAGQLYTERPRDAALAFALNAAFIAGAWESFDEGNETIGAILLFFEVGWYGGNIYNAVNHAHKYNRDLHEGAIEKLRSRYGLSLGLQGNTPQLGFKVQF